MTADATVVVCPNCGRKNRAPAAATGSSMFDGVSRACSRPGRWTMTFRNRPISE